jgi:hypothetical protein
MIQPPTLLMLNNERRGMRVFSLTRLYYAGQETDQVLILPHDHFTPQYKYGSRSLSYQHEGWWYLMQARCTERGQMSHTSGNLVVTILPVSVLIRLLPQLA